MVSRHFRCSGSHLNIGIGQKDILEATMGTSLGYTYLGRGTTAKILLVNEYPKSTLHLSEENLVA